MVKNLPSSARDGSLIPGWEDPLEWEMATQSNTFAWKIPWTEKPGRPQSMGWQRAGHDKHTSLPWAISSVASLNIFVNGKDSWIQPPFSHKPYLFFIHLFSQINYKEDGKLLTWQHPAVK